MFGYEYQVRRVCRLSFRERNQQRAYHEVVENHQKKICTSTLCLHLSFSIGKNIAWAISLMQSTNFDIARI